MYNLLAREHVFVAVVCRDTKEFSLFFIQLREKYFAFVSYDLSCAES